ncbi:MAG: FAD-dependent oxidoreductase, partial [Clostridia bacterium]|nr:FAD-dependent oxidoreductase [Clostridia bacterium]
VCPYELTVAACGVAMKGGCALFCNTAVVSLSYNGNGWEALSADGRAFGGRYVINCAGTHADEVAKMAGDARFSVRARRGEYYLLDREVSELVRTTVFMAPTRMGKGVLVSPTAHGNVIVGPTAVDTDDRDDTATTAEGLADVRRLAARSVRGVPFNRGITCFAGLRAVGSTGDFIIDAPLPGFVNCAGIESPGLSASPAIAEYVARLLAEECGAELSPRADFDGSYTPAVAFKSLPTKEKNEIIRRDPAYGRVVCRCETVTEGEIVAAIRQDPPARDLDAIKRRTRCGMGRCQGGFCTPYVTAILARELGISELEVTKSGGSSPLLCGKTKS